MILKLLYITLLQMKKTEAHSDKIIWGHMAMVLRTKIVWI